MKGNEEIIDKLNFLLADELTAISQYVVQASMCDNWEYKRLAEYTMTRAKTEMKHADALVDRILFLEGIPIVNNLGAFTVGSSVEEFHRNDRDKEMVAIDGYRGAMQLAQDYSDFGSFYLFQTNLVDEEDHINWIEGQIEQMQQMGITAYLAEQTK